MARPKLPESAKGKPAKIYMRNTIRKPAAALAYRQGISLSQLINELLRRELARVERKRAA